MNAGSGSEVCHIGRRRKTCDGKNKLRVNKTVKVHFKTAVDFWTKDN